MEDSRKGKRSRKKGLPTPDPHMDGGNGKKAIVYNTKREKRKGGGRNTIAKGKNLGLLVRILGHVRGYFLYRYMRITLSLKTLLSNIFILDSD